MSESLHWDLPSQNEDGFPMRRQLPCTLVLALIPCQILLFLEEQVWERVSPLHWLAVVSDVLFRLQATVSNRQLVVQGWFGRGVWTGNTLLGLVV